MVLVLVSTVLVMSWDFAVVFKDSGQITSILRVYRNVAMSTRNELLFNVSLIMSCIYYIEFK